MTVLHLELRLRMSGAMSLLSLHDRETVPVAVQMFD